MSFGVWMGVGASILGTMFLLTSVGFGFPVGFLPFGFFLIGGCWLAWWGRRLRKRDEAAWDQLYLYLAYHRKKD